MLREKLTPHITVKASYLDELAKLALQFGEFGLWEIRKALRAPLTGGRGNGKRASAS